MKDSNGDIVSAIAAFQHTDTRVVLIFYSDSWEKLANLSCKNEDFSRVLAVRPEHGNTGLPDGTVERAFLLVYFEIEDVYSAQPFVKLEVF